MVGDPEDVTAEDTAGEGLTRIHARIHCVATPEVRDGDTRLEEAQIDNFVRVLAEVSLAVARRKGSTDG